MSKKPKATTADRLCPGTAIPIKIQEDEDGRPLAVILDHDTLRRSGIVVSDDVVPLDPGIQGILSRVSALWRSLQCLDSIAFSSTSGCLASGDREGRFTGDRRFD